MTSQNDEFEWDEFDRLDTVYLVLRDERERVCGCARLLPTTRPYLMTKLLSGAVQGCLIADPAVWELSRVATVGCKAIAEDRDAEIDRMKILLNSVIVEAASQGIVRLIGVAAPAMTRLYRRKGFRLEPEGQVFVAGNEEIQQFSLLVDRDADQPGQLLDRDGYPVGIRTGESGQPGLARELVAGEAA